tara:strand:+ start:63 stop:245 length:183 start_codon:yes stop_codon:yes gene_type:complete
MDDASAQLEDQVYTNISAWRWDSHHWHWQNLGQILSDMELGESFGKGQHTRSCVLDMVGV